jgi:predicted nucleic acid-binding protein
MVVFYLDTSVIVKRYMNEQGTDFADLLYDKVMSSKEHSLVTSILSLVEFLATVRRARKGEIITEEDMNGILFHFTRETENINLRPLDEKTMVKSISIIMEHALRTADALHVSTALELRNIMKELEERVILISNDNEMYNATIKAGMEVIKPDEKGIKELSVILKND